MNPAPFAFRCEGPLVVDMGREYPTGGAPHKPLGLHDWPEGPSWEPRLTVHRARSSIGVENALQTDQPNGHCVPTSEPACETQSEPRLSGVGDRPSRVGPFLVRPRPDRDSHRPDDPVDEPRHRLDQ